MIRNIFMRCAQLLFAFAGFCGASCALAEETTLRLIPTANLAPAGYMEIIGVEADAFNPRIWESGKLNFVPDVRFPLLAPKNGAFRNIYAPSAVQIPEGYRLFYGAWDGISSGNDHIYSAATDEAFQNIIDRHAIISPGSFNHVCNVNALRFDNGSFALFGTVYPVNGQNRVGFFKSNATGTNWNEKSGEPYTVQESDIIKISGYNYTNSDINGMNVMLHEEGKYRLYFGDFHNSPGTFRASSDDGKQYRFEARVFAEHGFVNDVKKFRVGKSDYYLMGLHENGSRLWQTISTNGLAFPPAKLMLTNLNLVDRYIVALGWVARGAQESPDQKLLGVLYGAGPVPSLDHNQIFVRWLQKRVVFVGNDGTRYNEIHAEGPDRQLVGVPQSHPTKGHFEIYSDDGELLIGRSPTVEVVSGQSFRWIHP